MTDESIVPEFTHEVHRDHIAEADVVRRRQQQESMLEMLRELWLEHPTLRLGQMLCHLGFGDPRVAAYYVGDDHVERKMRHVIDNDSWATIRQRGDD